MRYGFYFLLTLLIELPVILLLLQSKRKQVLMIAFLLNLFTWPLLHYIYFSSQANELLLEGAVFLAEGIGYQLFFRKGWKTSLLISLLANGLSYGIGLLMR